MASKGSNITQLKAEVRTMSREDKQALLEDIEFKIEIPAVAALAMKSDLCLPWNRMRRMRRYTANTITNSFLSIVMYIQMLSKAGIRLASEKKQRVLAKHLTATERLPPLPIN